MRNGSRRDMLKTMAGGVTTGVVLAGQASAQGVAPREWIDAKTGHRIVRLSPDTGGGKLYFYKNSFTPQGDLMAISTPEGITLVDLKTRALRVAVRVKGAELMFMARRSRTLFYSVSDPGSQQPMDRPRTVFAIDIDSGRTRQVCRVPNGIFNALNADDTLLLGFVAYGSQPLQPGKVDPRTGQYQAQQYAALGPDGKPLNFAKAKGVRMLERWAARYPMEIFTIDVASGQRRVIHSTREWIGHTQFSPTDPQQIIFSHEGPWDRVDRMWTMRADGTGLRKLHERTLNFEIFGHEWFAAEGKQVFYDLQTPRGQVFWVASVDLASGRRVYRRVRRNDWGVHFNSSPDGALFASDGGDADMVAHAPDGKWISLLRPQTVADADPANYQDALVTIETMTAERLVDLSAHDYRLEPNLTFTPDGKWLVFGSNMHGKNHVYAVEIARR